MNLPSDFLLWAKSHFGNEIQPFLDSLEMVQPISIRRNPRKKAPTFENEEAVAWSKEGRYLAERPSFTLDPLFHAGTYYVQEASSMFLEQAFTQAVTRGEEPIRVLDLCAAPGGKSTHLLSLLTEDDLLVSNEYVSQRAHILSENIQKWGAGNAVVTNNAPKHFEKMYSFFDVVVIDAPCSGEGMFRKDTVARSEWSLQNVENCVERAKEIVTDIWSALKTDGTLIYSTCTFNEHEDEEMIQYIIEELDAEFIPLQTEKSWNVSATEYGYHFYPHKTKGEGFFMAVLRKKATERFFRIKPDKTIVKPTKDQLTEKEKISGTGNMDLVQIGNVLHLIPKKHATEIQYLLQNLHVFYAGIGMGEWKGKNFIPHTSLALCSTIKPSFPTVEVDKETALHFLRTENIILPDAPLGINCITYQGEPLGYVKNLGNRCNSLYPDAWRIRKEIK